MNAKNILILSPHTDDAELGCGGTISKLVSEGKNILWIAFSTCEESLPKHLAPDTLAHEFKNVVRHLGLSEQNYRILDYSVRKLSDRRQEILEELVKIKKEFNPDLVIGPSLNDFHQDHNVVANEMVRAFKTSASILSYELPWNNVEFHTQFFVKLEHEHMMNKIRLLEFYKSQIKLERNYFSKELITGLSYIRGAQVEHKYAEAFEVIRWVSS